MAAKPTMPLPNISDFEVLEKLGEGSYSTVFKARHKVNNTVHALKCVKYSTTSKVTKDALVTEIHLLRSLQHKNIVTLQDFFWDNTFIYIVLEYCNAGNLSSFIRSKKRLPEITCRHFARQLASAMEYMRSNDISHFDLKPQNLLLTRTPNICLKVADFGFAQRLKLGEINDQIKGSPLYMAPEIICTNVYDAKADLWSAGVILYECIFGKAPYSSRTFEELMLRIRNCERIVIPNTIEISAECRDLLVRLLVHDPVKRISFAEFFAHPFLDLKTVPTERTLRKAVELVTKAVDRDNEKDFKEAYYLYCAALQYFVPLITEESDAEQRISLRNQAIKYLNRAEELKHYLMEVKMQASKQMQQAEMANGKVPAEQREYITDAMEPDKQFKELVAMCNSSPNIKSALEIGRQGELYLYERKFSAALNSFTSALNVLMPLSQREPPGERRKLLMKQIDCWMKEAESLRSILSAKDMDDEHIKASVRHCIIQ